MIRVTSAKSFCRDDYTKIENYKEAVNDITQTWELHHRNEFTLDGKFAHTANELKEINMYFKRPANELIFLPRSVHKSLHAKNRKISEDIRKKISDTLKGHHLSEDTRRKMSESHKGNHLSEEARRKISEASNKYQESKRNGNNV